MDQVTPSIARWEELEVLLGCVYGSREEAAEQGRWIERVGWRVQVYEVGLLDAPPNAADGTLVYARVTHPENGSSPGELRYRR